MSKIEDSVIAKIKERQKKGEATYGVTMEREDLSERDWLIHAQEEAMDLAIYLEKLIQEKEISGIDTTDPTIKFIYSKES